MNVLDSGRQYRLANSQLACLHSIAKIMCHKYLFIVVNEYLMVNIYTRESCM